jgi:hypothetical protein
MNGSDPFMQNMLLGGADIDALNQKLLAVSVVIRSQS